MHFQTSPKFFQGQRSRSKEVIETAGRAEDRGFKRFSLAFQKLYMSVHKAPNLSARGNLTCDGRVVLHRVDCLAAARPRVESLGQNFIRPSIRV